MSVLLVLKVGVLILSKVKMFLLFFYKNNNYYSLVQITFKYAVVIENQCQIIPL